MDHLFERIRRLRTGKQDDEPEVRTDGGVATDTSSSGLRDRLNTDFFQSMPFWLPPFALVGVFVYGAIGWNFLISLTDYENFGRVDYSSLDFEMYVRAFNDSSFIQATQNTVVLLLGFIGVCMTVGLLLAILVDRNIRFENTFRTIYLLPMSLSFVVTAQFWLWMYNFNNGVVNTALGLFGLGPFQWFGNPDLVLPAVIFALVWQFSGYAMVVFLASLRAIPREHYEAARVDGASTVKMYWRVIIPQLKNAVVSALVVLMVFGLKAFDFLYAISGGYQPPNGSDILPTLMVRMAFQRTQWAYGSAIAILLFLLALGIITPYLYYQYKQGTI
ncbi:carbohydrate ABC transporter membrane protein 1, CUT1 family [Natronoarchaeum philippinense]|uniref:Carbohydrate ABC transporter membrane protein 1, CUT1 family n=1 Tax=Natronoarchaeum philippinense TaxID=558529 RepID=A0A285N6V0_NATPI|nr:sugar ABC transporter permease [Natronoarchaeum philippinense]SNZ03441.1 carbohydrate ABC transporter membrane protein 1, CUT1 family [Natronoarchaeum philippinense]